MDEVLSLPKMARRLGVTAKWLKEQADSGLIPCLKAGSRYLFSPGAVESALAKAAAESRAEVLNA